MAAALLGDKALDRKLKRLSTTSSNRAITAGIRASMTPVARAMRSAVNASEASTSLKREARRAIGQRFAKAKGGPKRGIREAKVGFGVGQTEKVRARKVASGEAARAKGESSGKGVGVGVANIHWFVLGTDERVLKHGSERGPKAGHPTGEIDNVFGGVTRLAFAASNQAAVVAARKKIWAVTKKEALRRG